MLHAFLLPRLGRSSGIHAIGGPQALSFLDIVRLYEKLLGQKLEIKKRKRRGLFGGLFRAYFSRSPRPLQT